MRPCAVLKGHYLGLRPSVDAEYQWGSLDIPPSHAKEDRMANKPGDLSVDVTDGDLAVGIGGGLTIDADGDLGMQIAPGISIEF